MHRDTMTRREEQMERDQLGDYVLELEQKLIDQSRKLLEAECKGATKELARLRPLLERCLGLIEQNIGTDTITGRDLRRELGLPEVAPQEVAGTCPRCSGVVLHRPGKPGEYDHACRTDAGSTILR